MPTQSFPVSCPCLRTNSTPKSPLRLLLSSLRGCLVCSQSQHHLEYFIVILPVSSVDYMATDAGKVLHAAVPNSSAHSSQGADNHSQLHPQNTRTTLSAPAVFCRMMSLGLLVLTDFNETIVTDLLWVPTLLIFGVRGGTRQTNRPMSTVLWESPHPFP